VGSGLEARCVLRFRVNSETREAREERLAKENAQVELVVATRSRSSIVEKDASARVVAEDADSRDGQPGHGWRAPRLVTVRSTTLREAGHREQTIRVRNERLGTSRLRTSRALEYEVQLLQETGGMASRK